MRTSSRVRRPLGRLPVIVVLTWRKVPAVPDGRGDVNGLLVATVAGALGLGLGLGLLTVWLSERERGR